MKRVEIIPAILVLLCIGIVIYVYKREATLEENFFIADGYIYEAGSGGNQGGKMRLEYYLVKDDHKYYAGNTWVNYSWSRGKLFLGKKMPVAVSPDDYNNSRMLLTKVDFKEFDIVYPDTLLWIDTIPQLP